MAVYRTAPGSPLTVAPGVTAGYPMPRTMMGSQPTLQTLLPGASPIATQSMAQLPKPGTAFPIASMRQASSTMGAASLASARGYEPGTPLSGASPWSTGLSVPVATASRWQDSVRTIAGGSEVHARPATGGSHILSQGLAPQGSVTQLGTAAISGIATPMSIPLSSGGAVIRKTSSPVRKKTSRTVHTGTARRTKDDVSDMQSLMSAHTPPTPLDAQIKQSIMKEAAEVQSILQEAAQAVQTARERDAQDDDASTYSKDPGEGKVNGKSRGTAPGKKIVHLSQLRGKSDITRQLSPSGLKCKPSSQSVGQSPSVSRAPSAPPTPKVVPASQIRSLSPGMTVAAYPAIATPIQPSSPGLPIRNASLPLQVYPSQPGTPIGAPSPWGASPTMVIRTLQDVKPGIPYGGISGLISEPRSPTMSVISGSTGWDNYDIQSIASAPVGVGKTLGGKRGRSGSQRRKIQIGAARYSGQVDKNRIDETAED
mmetsp:Transcript_120643/g.219346  ORF Transcript_120643/g.219346 Transcript_120643/m.219346 type:complete len:483 (-) Transcript_120643:208-1656(-)